MTTFWFIVIAILWAGFLVLEGFDFGVGALHATVGRDEPGRRAVIGTISPVWDGNEVWLITAATLMFAAFPGWYATMFSGLYLALGLLLVALILRGVAIEFRGRRDRPRWRAGWSLALIATGLLAPLLIGIALGDLLYGLPVSGEVYVGTFADLFSVYSVLVGLTFVGLSVFHGAVYIMFKTSGVLHARAARVAVRVAPVLAVAVVVLVIWTHALPGQPTLASIVEILTIIAVVAAGGYAWGGRDGWAFAWSCGTMAGVVLSIFANLYPRVLVSTLGPANDLTIDNASSSPYALKVMTVVVVILLPTVALYQVWAFRTFRRRVSVEQ